MLYLTRRVGEKVIINDTIEVSVESISGKTVKLGFHFPPDARILRYELFERIQQENQKASLLNEEILKELKNSNS